MRKTVRQANVDVANPAKLFVQVSSKLRHDESCGAQVSRQQAVHATHRVLVIVCFSLAILVDQAFARLDMLNWPVVSALVILILGAPHGALDVAIAKRRHGLESRRSLALFLLSYLALAAAVLMAWWLLPGLTLMMFLVVSAVHFGGDWHRHAQMWQRALQGGAMLAATAVLQQVEVAEIFALLAPADAAQSIAAVMHSSAPPLLAATTFLALTAGRQNRAETLEFMLVLAGAVLLAPITFFILYFCLLHSIRHFLESWEELEPCTTSDIARAAFPYATAAIIGCCAGAFALAEGAVQATLLPAVFVALAALTVPHMLLLEEQ